MQQSPLKVGTVFNFNDALNNNKISGSCDIKKDLFKQSYESFSFQEKLSISPHDLLNTVPNVNGSTNFVNGLRNSALEDLNTFEPNISKEPIVKNLVSTHNLILKENGVRDEFMSISDISRSYDGQKENQNELTINLSHQHSILTSSISQSDLRHGLCDISSVKSNNNSFNKPALSINNQSLSLIADKKKQINHLESIQETEINLHDGVSSANQKPKSFAKAKEFSGTTPKMPVIEEERAKVMQLNLKKNYYIINEILEDTKEKQNTETEQTRYLKIGEQDDNEVFLTAFDIRKEEDEGNYFIYMKYPI